MCVARKGTGFVNAADLPDDDDDEDDEDTFLGVPTSPFYEAC